MKILLYVNSYLPKIGGRELVVHHLATQYQKLGHEVLVAGPAGKRRFRKFQYGYPLERWPILPVLPAECSWFPELILTKFRHRFDIIHAHSTYPTGYVATKLKWLLKTPVVITPHGEDINVIPEIGFGQRLDPKQDPKIRYAVNHADSVTAISETIAESLVEVGLEDSKIERISNGVDLDRFRSPGTADVHQHFGIPVDSEIVTSIGNYHRRKGHEVLIESVRQALPTRPKLRLIIVGNPSPDLRTAVENQGLSDYVKFAGMLPLPVPGVIKPDVLASLLQASKIYVSASMDEGAEGLSLALLEAMAAGACPIVTDVSGNRDVITNEANGLVVQPGNPKDLSIAISRLMNNPELHGCLQKRSGKFVDSYGWRGIAEQYLDLYEKVV